MATSLDASGMSFFTGSAPAQDFHCTAKFRYRQADVGVTVHLDGDNAHIVFDEPVRAITPGQAVVLYNGEECYGGGTIDVAYADEKVLQYV
jgi:tRNA-specific 2-thiouridylase